MLIILYFKGKMASSIRLLLLIGILAMVISVYANKEDLVPHFASPHRRVSRYTTLEDFGTALRPLKSFESHHRSNPRNT
jgi:hypothetical protein